VDKVIIDCVNFFSGFHIPKIIKIGLFLTESLKNKNVIVSLKRIVNSSEMNQCCTLANNVVSNFAFSVLKKWLAEFCFICWQVT